MTFNSYQILDLCELHIHEQLKEITYAWWAFPIEKDPVANMQSKTKISRSQQGVTITNTEKAPTAKCDGKRRIPNETWLHLHGEINGTRRRGLDKRDLQEILEMSKRYDSVRHMEWGGREKLKDTGRFLGGENWTDVTCLSCHSVAPKSEHRRGRLLDYWLIWIEDVIMASNVNKCLGFFYFILARIPRLPNNVTYI